MKNHETRYTVLVYVSLFVALILLLAFVISMASKEVAKPVTGHTEAGLTSSAETAVHITTTTTSTLLIDTPILYSELFYYEFSSIWSINEFILEVDTAISTLIDECQLLDKYTDKAIAGMIEEVDRLTTARVNATRQKERLIKWATKETEYYYATRTWKFLKELGYSDIACAGILGNLMAECGGHTLKLDPVLHDKTGEYYGMFQWSTFYYPDVEGIGFEEQLAYYEKTSVPIFKAFGKLYKEGFTLDDFNALTDPREAALAFAKVYERCSSRTYERRQNFADIAYQYFVVDFEDI